MNATQTMSRSSGMLIDIISLAFAGGFLASIVQLYYLIWHKVDFFLGTAGVQVQAADRLDHAIIWGVFGMVCLAIATRWAKLIYVIALLLAIYTLVSLNGTVYKLNSHPTIDPNTLPTVSETTAPAYDHPANVLKKPDSTGATYTRMNAKQLAAYATEQGYTLDKVLTGSATDPNTPLGWCYAINPNTGSANRHNSEHSVINCGTGYRYAPPTNAS